MKKNLTLSLLLVLFFSFAYSQPILTSANSSPVIGESFLLHIAFLSGPQPLTYGGANQTWNIGTFSNLQDYPFSYVSPSPGPYDSLFPAATIGLKYPNRTEYYLSSLTEMVYLGVGSDSNGYTVCTDPEIKMVFPFTYNDSFTDTVSSIYYYGISETTADGYGTLILPYGTINNVLRVHVSSYQPNYNMNGDTVFWDGYFWYKPGIHQYIGIYVELITPGSSFYIINYLDESNTSVEHLIADGSFNLYPNPANESLMISNPFRVGDEIILTDVLGKTVFRKTIEVPISNFQLQTSSFPNGIYFVKINNGEKVYGRKMVVSH